MTASGVISWSQTASSNASADSSVNFAEGMAPSAINDSARGLMSSVAKYRDDIAGSIVTGGTATAYTVTSNQNFGSTTIMDGQMIAFIPHATNTGACTLNVDSLGDIDLLSATNTDISAGVLVAGTPYTVTYVDSDSAFYLHGFYGNPYNVPIGALMPYVGSTAPNSNFILPYGQAISRSTYSTLFGLTSTAFGTGDGSTTFNVPDLRGRAPFGKRDMGGTDSTRITVSGSGMDGTVIGTTGGAESVTLTTSQIPSHTHTATVTDPEHTHGTSPTSTPVVNTNIAGGFFLGNGAQASSTLVISSAKTGISVSNSSTGGGGLHTNMPPTIITAYILRVI